VIACLDSYDLSLGMRPDTEACDGGRCGDPDRPCDGGSCGECQSDRDCDRESLPRCDLEAHSCVRCLSEADCDEGRICSSAWHRCVEPCQGGDDCTDRDRPFCETEQSACVECLDDGDCREECVRGVCD
jgi:hypothetical protein